MINLYIYIIFLYLYNFNIIYVIITWTAVISSLYASHMT